MPEKAKGNTCYYMGKPVVELTKEELVEAVENLAEQLVRNHEDFHKAMKLFTGV